MAVNPVRHRDIGTTMNTAFSALNSAAGGIQSNLRGLNESAQQIASALTTGAEPTELTDALVAAQLQVRALEASANVARRIDEALGSLIDTFA